jgi:hypothetical protein
MTLAAPVSSVREFEAKYSVRCPDDFERYLTTIGGMPPGSWDENLIRFWPLDEIIPVAEACGGSGHYEGYFIFADYSISAHEYAINLSPKNNDVALVAGPQAPRPIAPNFTSFLATYLRDPQALFRG